MSANNIDIFSSKQTLETRKKQNNVTKRSYFHIYALFGILFCILLITHTSEATAEVFLSFWGSDGTGDGQFQKPWGIDTDSVNDVYVADINNNRIQKFTSDGKFITSWGSEILKFPKNIHISTNDVVYVSDTGNHRIQVLLHQAN